MAIKLIYFIKTEVFKSDRNLIDKFSKLFICFEKLDLEDLKYFSQQDFEDFIESTDITEKALMILFIKKYLDDIRFYVKSYGIEKTWEKYQ